MTATQSATSAPRVARDTVDGLFRREGNGPGTLVSVVGFDGSGKTTQVEELGRRLREAGHEVVETRQPTDWYREQARVQAFHDRGGSVETAHILALLAAADRRLHVQEVIDPALRRGAWVICDRYVYATFGVFVHRGVDPGLLALANAGIPRPDHAFYLEVPPEELLRRLAARDGDRLKFEEQTPERVRSIIRSYEEMGSLLTTVDGTLDPAAVTDTICRHVGLSGRAPEPPAAPGQPA